MSEDEKKDWFLLSNAFNAYNMEVLGHFATENYAWRFDIVQTFFLSDFVTFCLKIHIRKYLKQFSTFDNSKCFNSFCEWYILANIRTVQHMKT